jgi:tRNA(Ile)-lysidine synthase
VGIAAVRYLVAVSGGVDSVVLLDKLVRAGSRELIVAHFDHGIRSDSAADARFVQGLAVHYQLPFVTKREALGEKAGEEAARKRRYAFLRYQAEKHGATIVTAHHQDDVVESIAINLVRGTGWRGLAVLGAEDIIRPLLPFSKIQLREYALAKRLEWVEDSTNASAKYLRNRIRRQLQQYLPNVQKQAVIARWQRQLKLKKQIAGEIESFTSKSGQYSRYLLTMVDPLVAIELLRALVAAKTGVTPARPQTVRALLAVKTARPGSTFEIGGGTKLQFTSRTFIVADY